MPQNNSKSQREYRRKGAEERQRAYDSLDTANKLETARAARGNSKRQIARLEESYNV